MRKLIIALLVTFPLTILPSANAQLFGRKPKGPPAQRVSDLIIAAKTDQDERKRAAAAEELRDFDSKAFPEIVPMLIDVARNDAKPGVRLEAVNSLAKIRPVSQAAGQLLEWSAANDDSWKVRWQAKSSLVRYQWSGYHGGKNEPNTAAKGPTTPQTQEPPLYDPRAAQANRQPVNAGTVSRAPTPKANVPASNNVPKTVAQPPAPPPPVVVPDPLPKVIVEPALKLPDFPPPPPIIIQSPGPKIEPEPKLIVPQVPGTVTVPAPQLGPPPAPAVSPPTGSTEPNFRPAGQAPPRPGISTAAPQVPSVVPPPPPPAKSDNKGPALTPPM